MSTFMKGDTALEVASALARTDPNNHQSMQNAVEVVKIYVRAKIKKAKGSKAVGAPGGKLEALEKKYAHLGYQDIFYIVRLSFGLPPSAIDLPRPSSPVRRQLVKAKYPLPIDYQVPLGGLDDGASSIITASSGSTRITHSRDSPFTPSSDRPRGRDLSVKSLSRGPSTSTLHREPQMGSNLALGSTLSVASIPATPSSPASIPIPISSSHCDGETDKRDFFDQSVHKGSPPSILAQSPRLTRQIQQKQSIESQPIRSEADHNANVITASSIRTDSVYTNPVSQCVEENVSHLTPPSPTRAEDDVRRMLQARIKALQTALRDLEVVEIPKALETSSQSSPMLNRTPSDAPSSYSARRQAGPSHPPPNIPLPPLPAPDLGQPFLSSTFRSSPQLPSIRTTTLQKQSGLQITSTPPQPSPETPHSPELVFDLEPEIALDPFAPMTGSVATTASVYVAASQKTEERSSHLRRVKLHNSLNGRYTPPPKYEYEENGHVL